MLFCYWSVYQLFIDAEIKGCPLVRIFYNGIYIYRIYDKQLILPSRVLNQKVSVHTFNLKAPTTG